MSWLSLASVVASLVIGALACTTVPNPRSCADGFCDDPAFPFCDVDGTIAGGDRLTCIAVACTPLEFEACRGDDAVICNEDGTDYNVTSCANGCDPVAGRCRADHIVPKYLPTVCDEPAAEPTRTFLESMTLDTNVAANCNGGIVVQATGPEICVVRYGRIEIAPGTELAVKGARALALVSDAALSVAGILDVSANSLVDGPGGGFELAQGTTTGNAYGGIGFRTRGGSAGTAGAAGGANNGGDAAIDPGLLVELVGAPRSYRDGMRAPDKVASGGAGGSTTLVSCQSDTVVTGMIDAGGGGGSGGQQVILTPIEFVAGGGGAGGYVVLQGFNVVVTGSIFANGGGGGAGRPFVDFAFGMSGADGARSTEPAVGGSASPQQGGGGAGGTGLALPGVGDSYPEGIGFPGAGGGSAGFLQTYTPAGITPRLTPLAVSPPFSPNRNLETR